MSLNKLLFIFSILLLYSGCASLDTSSTYTRSEMGRISTVMKAKIISIRDVKIKGNSNVGNIAGAGIGAAGGASIGGTTESNIAGAIAGAVVGATIGASIEENSTKASAFEFIIRQENGQLLAIVQTNKESLKVGDKVLIIRSGKTRIIKDTTIE